MNTRSHKVVLLGDSGVGKSSLAHRIKFHSFPTDPASTIGCEFFAKTWSISEDEECKFLIWGHKRSGGVQDLYPSVL